MLRCKRGATRNLGWSGERFDSSVAHQSFRTSEIEDILKKGPSSLRGIANAVLIKCRADTGKGFDSLAAFQ